MLFSLTDWSNPYEPPIIKVIVEFVNEILSIFLDNSSDDSSFPFKSRQITYESFFICAI